MRFTASRAASALGLADVVRPEQDLALEIGERDRVRVDDPQRPDARRGEIGDSRAADAAGADDDDMRVQQPGLARPPISLRTIWRA